MYMLPDGFKLGDAVIITPTFKPAFQDTNGLEAEGADDSENGDVGDDLMGEMDDVPDFVEEDESMDMDLT